MADDLASIISGTDPMSPLVLRVLQSQQLLNSARDASQWQNQGIFGALGRTIAAAQGSSGANQVLQQLASQRAAGLPATFQALASGNPYAWGANPANGASPTTLASILANAPDAAKAQFAGSSAALNLNNLASLKALGLANQQQPAGTTPAPNAAIVNKAPIIAPTTPAPQSAVSPVDGILAMPAPAAMASVRNMNAQMRAQLIAGAAQNPQKLQQLKALFAQPGAGQ